MTSDAQMNKQFTLTA